MMGRSAVWVLPLIVLAMLVDIRPVHSRPLSVGSLHAKCSFYLRQPAKLDARKLSKQNVADMAICSAFIAGFNFGKVTANELNDTVGPYCLPRGYERGDRLIKNFVRWAAKNKRYKGRTAGFGLLMSLREHYACDERDRKN